MSGQLLQRLAPQSRWDWKLEKRTDRHGYRVVAPDGGSAHPSRKLQQFHHQERATIEDGPDRNLRPDSKGCCWMDVPGVQMLSLGSDDVVITSYRVIHAKVAIRAGPSLGSRVIGVARSGDVVDTCGGMCPAMLGTLQPTEALSACATSQ